MKNKFKYIKLAAILLLITGCGTFSGSPKITEVNDRYSAIDYKTKKWGFIDRTGEMVIEAKYEEVNNFSDGLARVKIVSEEGRTRFGYINRDGKIVVRPEYILAEDYADGLAKVRKEIKSGFEFIDTRGRTVFTVPEDIMTADYFSEGLIPFMKNDRWGFLDKKGEIVIDNKFDRVEHFANGLAPVTIGSGFQKTVGFIDKTGEFVIQPKYGYAYDSEEDVVVVAPQRGFGSPVKVIDRETGDRRAEIKSGACNITEGYNEGLLGARGESEQKRFNRFVEKCGFLDKEGNFLIKPQFNDVQPFYDGLAAVQLKRGGKWGYIDKNGELVIPYEYDFATPFNNGLAVVKNDPLLPLAYINKQGEIVWKMIDY